MGNINLARRHPDYPVEINGAFVTRVQSIDLNDAIALQTVDELGNAATAGVSQDPAQYTGSIRWFPIDNTVENLFAATSGSVVTLALLTGNEGVPIKTPKSTMTGCRVTGGTYSIDAPNGEFQATYNFKGSGFTTDQSNVIVATSPSGVGAYKVKDVKVQIGSNPVMVRCSGVNLRFDIPNQELYELNNAGMVGVAQDSPHVTATVNFYESELMAGNVQPLLAAPADLKIYVNSTTKVITMKNAVGGGQSQRGTVRGWATRQYNYASSGDLTTLGLSIGVS